MVRLADLNGSYELTNNMLGKACFVAERTLVDNGEHDGLCCTYCNPPAAFDEKKEKQRLLEHIGAHVLYDPVVDRSSEPCGLCLQPAPACQIYIKQGRAKGATPSVDMKRSPCPNLVKFSFGPAPESSSTAPCSNHPIVCDLCPNSAPAVWSYNFAHHRANKHPRAPGLALADDPSHLLPFEHRQLKHIWDSRTETARKKSRAEAKNQRAPLNISEAHSSQRILE